MRQFIGIIMAVGICIPGIDIGIVFMAAFI